MKSLAVLLVLAGTLAIGSAAYRPSYLYALVLSCDQSAFEFQGITTIILSVYGQNYSYTNLTTYGSPQNYTKLVELDMSLSSVPNVTIDWRYTQIDEPEFIVYRPLIQCRTFSIIPIYDNSYGANLRYDKRGLTPDYSLDQMNLLNQPYNANALPGQPNYNPQSTNSPYNPNPLPLSQVPTPNRPANYNPTAATNQYPANNRPYATGANGATTYREKPIFFCLDRYSLANREGIAADTPTQLLRCGNYGYAANNNYVNKNSYGY